MKKKIFFLLLMLVFIPYVSKADECPSDQRERIQKMADNITVNVEENQDGTFTAVFAGVSRQVSILNRANYAKYWNIGSNDYGEIAVKGLQQGSTYYFYVESFPQYCLLERFRTITINIPKINPFYKDEICDSAKEYSLCQKWTNVNINYEEFTTRVNEYIKGKNKDNTIKEDTRKNFDFFQFYEKYYWPTFISMICILGILIYLWIKENKKNKL